MDENTIITTLSTTDEEITQVAKARDMPPIWIDGHPPFGHSAGYGAMELFLLSLTACLTTTLLTLLRGRMRVQVEGISAVTQGTLKSAHPKSFSHVHIDLTIASPDATRQIIDRAIRTAEDKICPVRAMVREDVHIQVVYTLVHP